MGTDKGLGGRDRAGHRNWRKSCPEVLLASPQLWPISSEEMPTALFTCSEVTAPSLV